jgi:hypothetical protein
MRINGNYNSNGPAPSAGRQPAVDAPENTGDTSDCRALIPLSPILKTERAPYAARQAANFLAHLIATEQALPQTRERRRAEPEHVVAIYATASNAAAVCAPSRDLRR